MYDAVLKLDTDTNSIEWYGAIKKCLLLLRVKSTEPHLIAEDEENRENHVRAASKPAEIGKLYSSNMSSTLVLPEKNSKMRTFTEWSPFVTICLFS
jgi:hypothetical protein